MLTLVPLVPRVGEDPGEELVMSRGRKVKVDVARNEDRTRRNSRPYGCRASVAASRDAVEVLRGNGVRR